MFGCLVLLLFKKFKIFQSKEYPHSRYNESDIANKIKESQSQKMEKVFLHGAFIFCYITNYHKHSHLKQQNIYCFRLCESRIQAQLSQGLTRPKSQCHPGCFLTWRLSWEECTSKLIWAVGQIHLLVAVEVRTLAACWLWIGSHLQPTGYCCPLPHRLFHHGCLRHQASTVSTVSLLTRQSLIYHNVVTGAISHHLYSFYWLETSHRYRTHSRGTTQKSDHQEEETTQGPPQSTFIAHDHEEESPTKNPKPISINYFRTITDQDLVEQYLVCFKISQHLKRLKTI